MAGLGNSGGFHIDGKGIREIIQDLAGSLSCLKELVSCADQSDMNSFLALGSLEEALRRLEEKRKSLDLTILVRLATPDIMISSPGCNNHTHHMNMRSKTSGTAAADDTVRAMATNKLKSTKSSIHLADTASHEDNLIYSETSLHHIFTDNNSIFESGGQRFEFALHCYDKSYFHVLACV